MLDGFKKFILRGNVVDMAVGVVIGAAFGGVVAGFSKALITPLIAVLVGKPDYVCDGLISNALVLPEGDDFLFAHALIQEGAYSSLLRSRRRELHLQAAKWFADRDPVLWAASEGDTLLASGAVASAAERRDIPAR